VEAVRGKGAVARRRELSVVAAETEEALRGSDEQRKNQHSEAASRKNGWWVLKP
jgi:hypothetical protein